MEPKSERLLELLDNPTPATDAIENHLRFQKHWQRQSKLTDASIEADVELLIAQIIGEQPNNPDASFEDKLNFLLDQYRGEDDAAMFNILQDLELSEINWAELPLGESKFFAKKTTSLQRAKSRKYYKQNRRRIVKKKRIVQNRISGKALAARKRRKKEIGLTIKNKPVKKYHKVNKEEQSYGI